MRSEGKSKSLVSRRKRAEDRVPVRASGFKVGDRVRIIDVPENLKDPDYDLKQDTAEPKLQTVELFRFCVGRTFTICGFGRFGHAELEVGRNPSVRKRFGWSDTIWIEPEFLRRVGMTQLRSRSKRG